MNKILDYNVTGQNIELSSAAMLVAGTVNEYTARFAFSDDWDGYQRVAVFNADGTEREQLLTDDTCKVPWEVLLPGAYLKVGVYGTRDGSRLPTIWTSHRQYIHDGAGPTDEAADPSPVLAEQILQRMGDLGDLQTEDKSSLVAAINEIWMSGGGGASVTDAAIDERGHLIITLSTGKTIDAGYAVGPAGPAGKDGKDGADGLPGKDGKDGSPGAAGKDGVGIQSVAQTTTSTEDGGTNIITVTKTDGTISTFEVRNGNRGSTGPAGADGKDGSQGPAGADGKTAYQYAQDGGYTGTEAEFAAKLAAEIPAPYTLPIASSTVLGGVQPVAKTDAMTQSVGVDDAGALWAIPGSGGGSEGAKAGLGLLDNYDITLISFTKVDQDAIPTGGIEITIDDNGNPFSYDGFILWTDAKSPASYTQLNFNGYGNSYPIGMQHGKKDSVSVYITDGMTMKTFIDGSIHVYIKQTYDDIDRLFYPTPIFERIPDKFTSIKIGAGLGLASVTFYKIWGLTKK